MATDHAALPVNGNYAPPGDHHPAPAEQQAHSHLNDTNPAPGTFGSQNANVPSSATGAAANGAHTEVSKDEVGWYFVEQYYTNLSRSPDKLHLFYTKRSQFVSGVEAEKVPVSVGRAAISERIKELGFQDCKVRVSNVDSQASFNNIVIQVIGEMSNKSAPHRKFVQTFVLAEQPNGYYVLNDIFRYINEEEDEEEANIEPYREEDAAPARGHQEESQPQGEEEEGVEEEEVKALTSSADSEQQQQQHDAEKVDRKLEEVIARDEPSESGVDEKPEQATTADDTNREDVSDAAEAQPAQDASAPADQDAKATPAPAGEVEALPEEEGPEMPRDPEPTPVLSPQPATPNLPSPSPNPAPQKPAAPKTWANLVAASKSAAAAAPSPANSTSPPPSQPKSAPTAPPATESSESTTPPPQPQPQQQQQQQNANSGWQTAGNDHARRQARPQSISGPGDRDKVLAYVKNVTEKVPTEALRSALLKYGDLAYFDVSRQKNCAFVEFSTAAGYNAAVAANPHQIAGEQIYVEERRPRSGAYGGVGYNANRGGPGRGRGGPDGRGGYQGRGGYPKDGGRGSFGPGRGRGGSMPMRGRGGGQSA